MRQLLTILCALAVCEARCKDRLHEKGIIINNVCFCADQLDEKEMVPIPAVTLHAVKNEEAAY